MSLNQMKLRMWVIEIDQNGVSDNKFYIDDPFHIPRVGEFVDGDKAGGWVDHVQWNFAGPAHSNSMNTVYVYLKEKKNG
jgi:hypothetical protein